MIRLNINREYSARIDTLRMWEGFARCGYWCRLTARNVLYIVLAVVTACVVAKTVCVDLRSLWRKVLIIAAALPLMNLGFIAVFG